jgi:hypothetical protein
LILFPHFEHVKRAKQKQEFSNFLSALSIVFPHLGQTTMRKAN